MIIEIRVVLGGILLGLATGMMLLVRGKILGCSGILFRSWDFSTYRPNIDNVLFILGLFLSGVIFNSTQVVPDPTSIFKVNPWLLILGVYWLGAVPILAMAAPVGMGYVEYHSYVSAR
ncbi:hypothetical protein [Legionella micdadei]|uniref:hypothetical protein n=1 Tax=Legionella micdadei TaxID=451 RepID=UPI0020A573BB|nr:hypothetical protein [Legionella micdadei]